MGAWIYLGPAKKDQARRKGHQTAGQVALIPVAPPDMTTTSPGFNSRLGGSPKTAGAKCPCEVKTLPSR